MTETKPKYRKGNFLIFTQIAEILDAETEAQRAKEIADLINVLLGELEDMGMDPVKVYEKRVGSKSEQVTAIKAKYDLKWNKIKEEIEADEKQ